MWSPGNRVVPDVFLHCSRGMSIVLTYPKLKDLALRILDVGRLRTGLRQEANILNLMLLKYTKSCNPSSHGNLPYHRNVSNIWILVYEKMASGYTLLGPSNNSDSSLFRRDVSKKALIYAV